MVQVITAVNIGHQEQRDELEKSRNNDGERASSIQGNTRIEYTLVHGDYMKLSKIK